MAIHFTEQGLEVMTKLQDDTVLRESALVRFHRLFPAIEYAILIAHINFHYPRKYPTIAFLIYESAIFVCRIHALQISYQVPPRRKPEWAKFALELCMIAPHFDANTRRKIFTFLETFDASAAASFFEEFSK